MLGSGQEVSVESARRTPVIVGVLSVGVMTLGLIWQFWIHLSGFIAKRARQPQAA